MKWRGFSLIFAIGVAVGFALWLRSESPVGSPRLTPPAAQAPGGGSAQVSAPGAMTAVGATSPGAAPGAVTPPADPEFQKWLHNEAKDINTVSMDSDQKKRELAKVLAVLTPAQAHHLLQTAGNSAAPAGERILSTYLLAEAGPMAHAELVSLISTPIVPGGPQAPHSEGETKMMQERAIRIMGVDALFARAGNDPAALAALEPAIANIPDPYIKAAAQRRLAEIRGH